MSVNSAKMFITPFYTFLHLIVPLTIADVMIPLDGRDWALADGDGSE